MNTTKQLINSIPQMLQEEPKKNLFCRCPGSYGSCIHFYNGNRPTADETVGGKGFKCNEIHKIKTYEF